MFRKERVSSYFPASCAIEVRGGCKIEGVKVGDGDVEAEKKAPSSSARAYGDEPYAPLPGRNRSECICEVVNASSKNAERASPLVPPD